jgi:hypothetical protein
VNTLALADLRVRGVVLEGGARLRVSCPAEDIGELRPILEAHRDQLLDELQDEAEADIAAWPLSYRRWLVQTIGFALSQGFSKPAAFWMSYRDIKAALDADRADVIAEAADDGMLRAALDCKLVTIDEVATAPDEESSTL